MAYIKRSTVALTTNAGGDATGYTEAMNGFIQSIRFVLPGAGGYANTADFTITDETTGATILTASNVSASFTSYPRAPTNDTAGVASLYAAAGEPVETLIPIDGRVKIVVAQGGDTKLGTFYVDVGG